jgi:SAM-dependent methyltransferase
MIVDLGCGSGTLLRLLAGHVPAARCAGLDVEPLALDLAKKALPAAEFHELDLADPEASVPESLRGKADVVVCSEVLEHLENPRIAVALGRTLLRDGGRMVVTVPSGTVTAFDRAIGHVRHYDLDSFEKILERDDLAVERSYRWGFPFHSLFRVLVGFAGVAPSQCTDANFGLLATVAFRVLDWLFYLNARSRVLGRQLVAVAVTRPAA